RSRALRSPPNNRPHRRAAGRLSLASATLRGVDSFSSRARPRSVVPLSAVHQDAFAQPVFADPQLVDADQFEGPHHDRGAWNDEIRAPRLEAREHRSLLERESAQTGQEPFDRGAAENVSLHAIRIVANETEV